MKKYIIYSLLIISIIIPVSAFSQADIDPNGEVSSCVSLQSTNLRYRSRDVNTNGAVSTLQDFLQSQNYLNSEPTGYFGLLTLKAVKDFQKANGISPTGYVGPITKAKIRVLTCDEGVNPVPTTPTGWQFINANSFTLSLPSGWEFDKLQGIDSYIGEFIGDGIRLSFDFGWYSNSLAEDNDSNHIVTYETIGGYKAKIVVPKVKGNGTTGVYFGNLENQNRFNLYGNNFSPSQQETALKIFRTIRFKTLTMSEPTVSIKVLDYKSKAGEGWMEVGLNKTVIWSSIEMKSCFANSANSKGTITYGWELPMGAWYGIKKTSGTENINVTDDIVSLSILCEGPMGSKSASVLVKNNIPTSNLNITTSSLPNAKVGQSYSVALNTSGGSDSSYGYIWSVNNGASAFPVPGLSFGPSYGNSNYITGIPAKVYVAGVEQIVPYTFTFSITVTSGSRTTTKQFNLTVDPAIVSTTPPPTVSLGNPTYYSSNNTAYMSWSATNVTSCVRLKDGVQDLLIYQNTFAPILGPIYTIVDLTQNGTNGNYSIKCTGPGGTTTSNSVTVTSNNSTNTCSTSGFDTNTGFRCGCSSYDGWSSTTGLSCAAPEILITSFTSSLGGTNGPVRVGDIVDVYGANFTSSANILIDNIGEGYYGIFKYISPSHFNFVVPTSLSVGTHNINIGVPRADGLGALTSNAVNLTIVSNY